VSASTGDIQRQLRQLFDAGSAVGLTDGQLLERFVVRDSDSAEAAFETILTRHGSTVLTVCRQVLGDVHAAEDAFQATFLVLVRRAGSLQIRDNASLGPWLYEVAYRTALKVRQGTARRRAREHRVAVPEARAGQGGADVAERDDLGAVLHQEVNRLPTKYRVPVVLCYFEGRTHDEAAATLHWPVGTVRSNLSRARDLLRSRLTRRGLAPAGWIGASSLETIARAEVPAALRTATVAAAVRGTPAAPVAFLAKVMLRSLLMARLKLTVGAVLTMALLAAGVGFAVQSGARPGPPADPFTTSAVSEPPRSASIDRFGDPLPKHARARLGTARFHRGQTFGRALYSPDGKFLVTYGGRTIQVWNAATGRLIRDIGDPQIAFSHFALSSDGATLATIDSPSRLRLWDLATGRERRRWHVAEDENYEHMSFSPDGRTVAVSVTRLDRAAKTNEKFIDLWDTAAPSERRRRIPGDWLWLHDLAFSPDGKTLATASQDTQFDSTGQIVGPEKGSTRLWDLATGRERQRFAVEGEYGRSLAISPDGQTLAVAFSDGTVRVYDRTTGRECMPRLRPGRARPRVGDAGAKAAPSGTTGITCLAFSPDGSILAAGSDGVEDFGDSYLAAIHLWDVARGTELRRIPAHQAWVASLSFSPDGQTLASTGVESAVLFWDVATGREAFPQAGHRSGIRALVISPADGTIFTGGCDGTIRQWDPATGRELGIIAIFVNPAEWLAVAHDGKTLLVGNMGGRFALWSVAERREIRRFPNLNDFRRPLYGIAWSPDGKTIAAEGRIWDAATGQEVVTLRSQDGQDPPSSAWPPISYSPDGTQVITALTNRGAWIFDVASGKALRQAIRSDKVYTVYTLGVALSPDGRFLASGGLVGHSRGDTVDPPIRLWELASGQEVATLEGPEESTCALSFSLDGRLLASGSGDAWSANDPTVRVWGLATGRELRRFDGHRGQVDTVVFSRDGRSVISGSEDGTALVWDVSDLKDHSQTHEPLTPESLQARWNELAGHDARAAYRATWALSVPSAVPFLRDHLHPALTSEPIESPEVLRSVRAITALERIHTPEARGVIERLSQGVPDAITTREAKSTLDHLKRAMGR
jgi:RNA polymerase sigma factor (sigma-70 family)